MLSWRSAAPAPVFRAKWQAPKPHVNTAFVTDLLDMADTWRIRVGEMLLGFYLERGLASNKTVPEEYYKCELANRLQVPMRLTGQGQRWPLYPRLARYAFFTGTAGWPQLDFPASHGQQFRRTACPGLPAAVKSAQPARVRQRPRQLAQGEPDGGHPTRTASPQERAHHSDAHGVARPQ